MNYQYFVEIVPTEVSGLTGMKKTYQYSVKDHVRPIDHTQGSHGTPGIYFKYDISALKVEVTKDRLDQTILNIYQTWFLFPGRHFSSS